MAQLQPLRAGRLGPGSACFSEVQRDTMPKTQDLNTAHMHATYRPFIATSSALVAVHIIVKLIIVRLREQQKEEGMHPGPQLNWQKLARGLSNRMQRRGSYSRHGLEARRRSPRLCSGEDLAAASHGPHG